ncbi:MAG: polyketide cyclase [Desulfofustis sp.]|nr:polyketide cyclase [Desulfofustis sp.]
MGKDLHQQNKDIVKQFRDALYDCEESALQEVMQRVFTDQCAIHLAYPFEDLIGPLELMEKAYRPLLHSWPDLERRDFIVMAGGAETGNWVGCGGYYLGVFERPWLDIPPTLHPTYMRFCEFYRLEQAQIVEMQVLWDIPQVMMQARAWPMAPALGVEWLVPAPAPQNGIIEGPRDEAFSNSSLALVREMLDSLSKFAEGGHRAMNLEKFWHPKMTWYGPAGIGTNRRLSGFRNWHQIPFLKGMPDREGGRGKNMTLIADGNFVGFTAWPGMRARISGDGWMGIAPGDQEITMRSLDFWRCENDLIRENWVLVDLLDVYHQIGVDVFSRMREFTPDRQKSRQSL